VGVLKKKGGETHPLLCSVSRGKRKLMLNAVLADQRRRKEKRKGGNSNYFKIIFGFPKQDNGKRGRGTIFSSPAPQGGKKGKKKDRHRPQ